MHKNDLDRVLIASMISGNKERKGIMNKKLRRSICIITAAIMALTFAACSSGETNAGKVKEDIAAIESTSIVENSDTAEKPDTEESPAVIENTEAEEAPEASEPGTKEDAFELWDEDAEALGTLIDYVEDVTDEASANYIPVEDRIAVFDMDGTLYAELFPTYIEYYTFAWRVLADPDYMPTDPEVVKTAETIRDCGIDKSYPDSMAMDHALAAAEAYADMTVDEFADYVSKVFKKDADGFEGMTYAEAGYKPMAEVIDYLNCNDFTCYVVSGSDRSLCRVLLKELFDVPTENIIGMDVAFAASGQGDSSGVEYVLTEDDEIIRTNNLLVKDIKMNKVSQIVMDIGKQPVLSFGNTSGDVSMHNYTIFNNPYKSAAFMLIADDEDRDYGNTEDAEEKAATWEEDGYNVISMKNDWKTIYGEDVKKTGTFRWEEELSGSKVEAGKEVAAEADLDYKVLVNKIYELPEYWEDKIELVHFTNTVGNDVAVEKKAYEAYLLLKEDLEKEGIFVDLDSAYRSVTEQQRIMDDFTKEYGEDYAKKTVAEPGHSEHHTGLALDLYLIIDGKNVDENEDMIQYTEIWDKIHKKLADYGFILRYLQDKEHITGYGYEPWHIRYLDDTEAAKEIMGQGLTYEGYLGMATETDVVIDYGTSEIYTPDQLKEAAIQIKCNFAGWRGCELYRLTYAGDEVNTQENIDWLNSRNENANYVKAAEFFAEFYTSPEGNEGLAPNKLITGYPWWLGMNEDGVWDIAAYGKDRE